MGRDAPEGSIARVLGCDAIATRRKEYSTGELCVEKSLSCMLLDTDTVAAMHSYSHSIVPGGLLVTSKRTSAICGSAALMAEAMSSQISKGTR